MRLILALAIALLGTGTARAQAPPTAQVCFVRTEDNGRMNLLAARIYGSHGSREELLATLVGGSKRCVAIEPGSWSFEARSSHPYTARAGHPNACKSEPLSAEVATTTTIIVEPKSKRSAYLCGWQVRLQAAPANQSSLCFAPAAADRCSGAEAGVAHLKTWARVAEWHECFSPCDDGCVAEDLDRRLTRMLAREWPSVVELSDLSEKQPRFKRFVLKHLGGDADPKELRKVRTNAARSCPAGRQDFCREIGAAVSRGLGEQSAAAKSFGGKNGNPDRAVPGE